MLQFKTLGVVSNGKVTILEVSSSFQKNREKPQKSDGKREFLCKTIIFDKTNIFIYRYLFLLSFFLINVHTIFLADSKYLKI